MAAASRIFLPPSSPQLTVFKVLRSAVTGKSPPTPVATAPPTPAASALASSTTPPTPAAVDTEAALDQPEQTPRNPVLDVRLGAIGLSACLFSTSVECSSCWSMALYRLKSFHLFQALKPHIPLIRFRKGGLAHATPSASAPVTPAPSHMAASAASPAGSKTDWAPKSTSVDWWQTPNKYRRRELDDIEIEAINVRGKSFEGSMS